jgi:hypothetical protein
VNVVANGNRADAGVPVGRRDAGDTLGRTDTVRPRVDDSVLLAIPVVEDVAVSLHVHVLVLVTTATLHRPALTRDLCIALD